MSAILFPTDIYQYTTSEGVWSIGGNVMEGTAPAVGLIVVANSVPNKIFTDGFENGSTAWTPLTNLGGTSTLQSTIKKHGTYAIDSSIPATAGAYGVILKDLGSTYSTLFVRAYVRFSVLPASPNVLQINPTVCDSLQNDLAGVYIRNNAGTIQWALNYRNDADPYPARGTGWAYAATPTPAINTWYCIEIEIIAGAGTGEVRLWVDGVELASATGLTNIVHMPQQVQVGVQSTVALAAHVYSDSVIADTQPIDTEADTDDYVLETITKMVGNTTYPNFESTIVFRYQNEENYYWAGLGAWNHKVSIGKCTSGPAGGMVEGRLHWCSSTACWRELASVGESEELLPDVEYRLKVTIVGNVIQVFINNVLELTFNDTEGDPLTYGGYGFRIFNSHSQLMTGTIPSDGGVVVGGEPLPYWLLAIPLIGGAIYYYWRKKKKS